jgi:hypothetical protein
MAEKIKKRLYSRANTADVLDCSPATVIRLQIPTKSPSDSEMISPSVPR